MTQWPGDPPGTIKPGTMCVNCDSREATEVWVGEGGWMGFNHGAWWPWCKVCVLKAQIEFTKKVSQQLPGLQAELEALEAGFER